MVLNFEFGEYGGNKEAVASSSDEQNITVQFLIVISIFLLVKYRKMGSAKF
jgi:hypothetical protein